jgi:hypothetical protein
MIYPISEIDISYVNLFAPARKLYWHFLRLVLRLRIPPKR